MSKKQPFEELKNVKFGRLTIVEEVFDSDKKHRKVLAICECGTKKKYYLNNIKRGVTISCGCYNVFVCVNRIKKNGKIGDPPRTHGLSKHPLYWIYGGIKDRCNNHNSPVYKFYGARGVKMCDEWLRDFKAFFDWAISNGWKKGLEIDKDTKGDGLLYSPETCCFLTEKQNCNKRISSKYLTFKGETKTVAQWSDIVGLSQQVIYKRMKRGWDVDKSLSTPLMFNKTTFKPIKS